MNRVFVVDDQDQVRGALLELFGDVDELEVVGEARDGAEAVRLIPHAQADVVLMDMRMPVMDGVEATRRLTEDGFGGAIVVHSAYGDDSLVLDAVQAGARGYVLKGSPPSEIINAIERVANGAAHISEALTRPMAERLVDVLAYERQTRLLAQKAATELEKLAEQRKEFAMQAAHELRTPLTSLLGHLELLIAAAEEPLRVHADQAFSAGRRLVRLAENLEVTASLGVLDFDVRPSELAHLVHATVAEIGVKDALCDVPRALIAAVDAKRFAQVLSNILKNAVIAAPDGTIRVTAHSDGSFARIAVSDEGPGFDDDALATLFEPFAKPVGTPCGLGVGLWVARELVTSMGGELAVSNNAPRGATVEFTLPIAAEHALTT